MLRALRASFQPSMVVLQEREGSEFGARHEALAGKATAYVCRGQSCAPPTTDVAEMMRLLG